MACIVVMGIFSRERGLVARIEPDPSGSGSSVPGAERIRRLICAICIPRQPAKFGPEFVDVRDTTTRVGEYVE